MIISFECDVSDRLKVAIDNYLHPKSLLLSLTDSFFVENKVFYFGRMVLIIERSFFDVFAEYMVYFGFVGLLFASLIGSVQLWSGTFNVSVFLILVGFAFNLSKVRFFLLRWRIHKMVDKDLRLDYLSKEQVVNRFIHSKEYVDGSE